MTFLIFGLLISAFDIYVIASYYNCRFGRKTSMAVLFIASAVLAAGQFGICHLQLSPYINVITATAICFALIFFFDATWLQRLFFPIIVVSLAFASETLAGILLTSFSGVPVEGIYSNPYTVLYQAGHVAAKFVFFIIVRVLCRRRVMSDRMLKRRHWLLIMAIPLKSLIVSYALAFSTMNNIITNPTAPLVILIGLMCINVLVFTLYDILSVQSKELVEHERAKNLVEADLRRYDAMVTQSKGFVSQLHDVRKHRIAVYKLLTSGNVSAAQSYLEKLCFEGTVFDRAEHDEPNAIAILILDQKTEEAQKHGIEVITNCKIGVVLPLDEVSQCLILGNALDNAIEACLKLPDSTAKRIDIDISYENNRLAVRIANTSNPVRIKDNCCATTKGNSTFHGYGLENIKKIAAEKGGNATIRYVDGIFILNVIFLF